MTCRYSKQKSKVMLLLKSPMHAIIKMIYAWFEPWQWATCQTDWTQTMFPASLQSDKVRICVASQLADCCSQSCSVCSLKGNCLDGCQHQQHHNSYLTLILTIGGQKEDFQFTFYMFSRWLSQQQQMHFWHYLSDIKDKLGDSRHRATFVSWGDSSVLGMQI